MTKVSIELSPEVLAQYQELADLKGTDVEKVISSMVELYADKYDSFVRGTFRAVENNKKYNK